MDSETERIVVAVSVGAGCMLLFVTIVLTILLCRARRCRHGHDSLDSHLVGAQSVLSDGRYSSRISENQNGNKRSHVFAKKEPSNSSAMSGFVYKPKHHDRLRKSEKGGYDNKAFVKNTVRSQRSSRSLPVMANVSNYGMDGSPPAPHFGHSQYDFSIPKAPATRSLFDYGRNVPGIHGNNLGFTRTRLPSSEQISFSSDGRFVVPGIPSPSYAPQQNNVYAHQIQAQSNYPRHYQLKNSDFYSPAIPPGTSPYSRYMNGTIERTIYEADHRERFRVSNSSNENQYYSSVGAYFDRDMSRT